MSTGNSKAVVLAGGGHAHLHSLLRTSEFTKRGYEVVLVNPSPYLYYSGMATGVISGAYSPEQDRIDVRRLVELGGGRFVEGRVVGILGESREVLLESGERIPYDYASLCIGSEVEGSLKEDSRMVAVKPVENTAEIRAGILKHTGDSGDDDGLKVLVVGGGAAGCEVAANVANLMRQKNIGGLVTIAEAGPTLLNSSPEKARRRATSYLRKLGVDVLTDTPVSSHTDGIVETRTGRRIEADLIVASVGIVPRTLKQGSYLLTGDDGGLWVNQHLQSVSEPRIFGGGDSISFRGDSLPRLGVFGIRQGPVLFRNLISTLEGRPLERYEPQKRYLYILEMGDGVGLAIYGPLIWKGRVAVWLKHTIDKRFMKQYQIP